MVLLSFLDDYIPGDHALHPYKRSGKFVVLVHLAIGAAFTTLLVLSCLACDRARRAAVEAAAAMGSALLVSRGNFNLLECAVILCAYRTPRRSSYDSWSSDGVTGKQLLLDLGDVLVTGMGSVCLVIVTIWLPLLSLDTSATDAAGNALAEADVAALLDAIGFVPKLVKHWWAWWLIPMMWGAWLWGALMTNVCACFNYGSRWADENPSSPSNAAPAPAPQPAAAPPGSPAAPDTPPLSPARSRDSFATSASSNTQLLPMHLLPSRAA